MTERDERSVMIGEICSELPMARGFRVAELNEVAKPRLSTGRLTPSLGLGRFSFNASRARVDLAR